MLGGRVALRLGLHDRDEQVLGSGELCISRGMGRGRVWIRVIRVIRVRDSVRGTVIIRARVWRMCIDRSCDIVMVA